MIVLARKKQPEESDSGTWLNTYADMVTLLLTFFAVLLGMSSVSEEKFNAFVSSLQLIPQDQVEYYQPGVPPGEGSPEFEGMTGMDQLYTYLKAYVENSDKSEEVSISKVDDVVYIRFNSDLLFEPDKYIMKNSSSPVLSFVSDGLKLYEKKIRAINICGHTAIAGPRSSTVSDWMLSGERAAVVADYLENEKGLEPSKIVTIGYGKNFPVADNATENGKKFNRRVELLIIGYDGDTKFDVYSALGSVYDSSLYPKQGGINEVVLPNIKKTNGNEETKPNAENGKENSGSSSNDETKVSPYND